MSGDAPRPLRLPVLLHVLLALLSISLAGCKQEADTALVPPPPPRNASPDELVGLWEYAAIPPEQETKPGEAGNFLLRLRPDGRFVQVIIPPGANHGVRQEGTWRVEAGLVCLTDVIIWNPSTERRWVPRPQQWPIIQSEARPGHVAIFGGVTPDRTLHHELKMVTPRSERLYTLIAGEI